MSSTVALFRRRWPKGTWMRLKSEDLLRAFVGDPAKRNGVKMSGRQLARRVINPETGRPIHPSFIDHLLTGRRTSCTPKVAMQIAEALEVPLEVLFTPRLPSSAGHGAQQQAVSGARGPRRAA